MIELPGFTITDDNDNIVATITLEIGTGRVVGDRYEATITPKIDVFDENVQGVIARAIALAAPKSQHRELPDVSDVDVANRFVVGTDGDTISMMFQRDTFTKDEALVLAAYLAVLADPLGDRARAIYAKVCET